MEKIEDDDIEDPVEKLIERTGCAHLHYAVQECYAEHNDWRKCQKLLTEFRQCMKEKKTASAAGHHLTSASGASN